MGDASDLAAKYARLGTLLLAEINTLRTRIVLALLSCSELRAELQPLIVVAIITTIGITLTVTVIIVAIFSHTIFSLL